LFELNIEDGETLLKSKYDEIILKTDVGRYGMSNTYFPYVKIPNELNLLSVELNDNYISYTILRSAIDVREKQSKEIPMIDHLEH
jgi:hypothetical protein